MSYRTFKRFVGETSLERKCRFLFGLSLLLLILCSFLWCGFTTEKIVYEKTRSNSRRSVGSVLIALHAEKVETDPEMRQLIKEMATELEGLAYKSSILALDETTAEHVRGPDSDWELESLVSLRDTYRAQLAAARAAAEANAIAESGGSVAVGSEGEVDPEATADVGNGQMFEAYKDLQPVFKDKVFKVAGEYRYYQPVYWQETCLICHKSFHSQYLGELATAPNADPQELIDRMPFRAVQIVVSNDPTRKQISWFRSFLITMAIVTVSLSMVALYIIVKYVIVKPLQHLQVVSEEVEQGNYDARASIQTRDEFEDLAGAFNRMVRHLVDTQTELQDTNSQLDLKVDELAQANMQLYEVNRMKSEFLANVSHELRTPLNSIIGFSDVLRNLETLNDKQKRYASNIGTSGKVLLEMINDILDLAKMESGKMNVRPTEFSIGSVCRAQIDVVQGLADGKNLDISFECPEDLPDIFQDQAKVQQILTNLLSNAIKFTPDGGRITVRAQPEYKFDPEDPVSLKLSVEDTGIGIAAEDHDVIFEKFRQATPIKGSDNLTREYSGTGLGLSIIRELCRLMGGEISFVSQLGHGSAFTVTVPWFYSVGAGSDLDTTMVTIDQVNAAREKQANGRAKNGSVEDGGGATAAGTSAFPHQDGTK